MSTAIDRSAFALDPSYVYLNHAAIGVLPKKSRDAVIDYVNTHATSGVVGVAQYELHLAQYRARFASFIGAQADEIAFVRNTSDAVNILARGLHLQPGDVILTNDNEFGANALPWLALRENGIVVRFIETARERMTPDALRREITSNTKIVALSWISFIDGYRHDLAALAEIAHAHGALIAVDAIQGLGAFPFSMTDLDLDAVYGGAQKWLLAEPGLGYLCLRSRLLDRISVRLPGWRSLEDIWNFLNYEQPYCAGVSRFEAGTPNLMGIVALMESLDLLSQSGLERIGAHIQELIQHLREGLQRQNASILSLEGQECESGILTFGFDSIDPMIIGQCLAQAGIVTTNRPNGIRVSPHGYNQIHEIDVLLESLTTHRLV